MDPTLEEKQSDQPQQKQSKEGTINQGINAINNLVRARRGFTNPLGEIGSRVVVQTALRGFAAFLAGPGLPIALALGAILFFTIIIVVGLGGVPSSESNIQAPADVPTLTPPTPSPAAP